MNPDRVIRYYPDLRTDAETGPPDARRGFATIDAWIVRDLLALAMRWWTTPADVLCALQAWPELDERVRCNPGPYSDLLGQHGAAQARRAMDEESP